MPIYEYLCKSCGHIFDKMESINTEERTSECPQCKGLAERKVSATSYQLTGSGFYNTDNKKPGCAAGGSTPCSSGGSCPMSK